MNSNNYNSKVQHKDSDSNDCDLRLTLSEKTKQRGLLKDVVINKKTNKIMATLNHDCKKVIISSIYTDWIKTTHVFEKQAERKGLSSENINQILDELDNNYESISEFILNNPGEEDSKQIKTKEVYIRKYIGNGNNIPLSESIVVGGIPNFLQVNEDKPVVLENFEIGRKTFYPYDTLETHNPIPYLFKSAEELNAYIKNIASYENLDSLFLKVKSVFKKYVDAEDRYITLLVASTILSYYQDKFGTIYYIIIVGDNGSGKNSALLVYRMLGYRVFYVTAASAANYYTFLGDVEEGQGTLAEDEADNIHLQPDKYKVCKTGYASGGSVPKVDIHNTGGRSQGVYLTFCMKWFAMEELPDYNKIKGFLDRSFVLKFVVGRPPFNIKDVIKNAGDPKFRPLYDELLEVRRLLLIHRISHYDEAIYDVALNIRNRNEELTKPLIRLFRNSPIALSEILPILSEFLNERNDIKKNSFESRLFQAIKNLIKNQEENGSKDTYLFSHEELCAESRKVMDGNDIVGKPQSFYTVEFGSLSHKKITETFRSKFKAKPYQTGGVDNKRCLIFSKEVIDRIAIYYDNPDRIEILSDDTQKGSDISTNDSSDSNLVLHNIKESNYDEPEQQEQESVTDVTNITDSNDAKPLDESLSEDHYNRNKENNSNNIDKISNSYSNLHADTLHSSSNSPSLSSSCVISVTSVTKKEGNENNNNVSLEDLPTLSCLFCPTYKTKIKFDMELHLFEKHKQNLAYNLPISKARMDDRIEYALDLVEQGQMVVNAEPDQSNFGD